MPGLNPAARRRELASRLRELRLQQGLTVEQVADQILCSSPKISRMETGVRSASPRDIRDLAHLYQASPEESQFLLELARQARQSGWWTQYYNSTYAQYVGLEQDAAEIVSYSSCYIPALLQTREYAQSVHENSIRRSHGKNGEGYAEAIIRRQEVFAQNSTLRYSAFLDETALRRQVGDAEIMRAQLGKLLEAEEKLPVSIQVLPFNAGSYSIIESNFYFLQFGDPEQQKPLVFIEGCFGDVVIERSSDLEILQAIIRDLRRVALSVRRSLSFIRKIMVEA